MQMLPAEHIFSSQSQSFDQYYLCFPLCLTSPPGFGGQPKIVQRLLPWLDVQRAIKHKKGAPKYPWSQIWICYPLIWYQDVTTPIQIHKIGVFDWGLEIQTIQYNMVMVTNASMLCRCQFPSGIQISKAKSHQYDPRDTTHERKTTGHRNYLLLPSHLCVWVLDDARSFLTD